MSFQSRLNSYIQSLQANNFGIPPQGQGQGSSPPPFNPSAQILQGPPPSAEEQRCPRPHPQPGLTDWFILHPNPNFPPFHVCPHCYRLQVQPTPFISCFARATSILPALPIACDLGRFWVLFAGVALSAFNDDRRLDISVLPRVKSIVVADGDCPNAQLVENKSPPAPALRRMWYTVRDMQGVLILPAWTICMHCVVSIQTILPAVAAAFVPAVAVGPSLERCAFMPADGVLADRNAKLMHCLGECAKTTSKNGGRIEMTALVNAVRSNSGLLPYSPCPRDTVSQSRKCHLMREIPEFTVCEDCYSEVILTGVQKDVELAKRLSSTPALSPGGFTCQLYSERMRRVWAEAAGRGDIEFLRQKVVERRLKEREIKMKISNLKRQQDQLLMQMGMTQGLGLLDLEVEMGRLTNAWQTQLGMYRCIDDNTIELPNTTPNLSMLTRMNSQSGSIQMQNAEIESQIRFAEEEWRQYWE